ncbi:MAG: RNA-binding protein [Treponema sp.]|nr:RNA-binding protein [Treponema sp.]
MQKKIYIGNLSFATTEERLTETFSKIGNIESAVIIKDRETGNSKGFGFVDFAEESDAAKAVAILNGKELDGRKIRVSYAK